VNAVDVNGLTPLHIAARENYNGKNMAASCLLALGADAGIIDGNGNSYEDLATQRHQMQSRFSEVIASSKSQEVRQALSAAIFSNRGSLEEMNAVLAAVESCRSEEERKELLDRLAERDGVGTKAAAARETMKRAYIAKIASNAANAAEGKSEFNFPGFGAEESATPRITDGIGGGAKKNEKKRKKKKKRNEKATKQGLEMEKATKQDLEVEKKVKGTQGAKGVISRLPVEWMMQRARAMASCDSAEERGVLAAGMEAHLPAEKIDRLTAAMASCDSKKEREAIVGLIELCGSYEEIDEKMAWMASEKADQLRRADQVLGLLYRTSYVELIRY
jgi:hypothetical protein